MISRRSEEVLNRAGQQAMRELHEFVTVEHVFLALLDEGDVVDVIEACGADIDGIEEELIAFLKREMPKVEAKGDRAPPEITLAMQNLLQRALFHAQSSAKGEVQPLDLFVAIFHAKDTQALYLLKKHGIDRLDVISYISHGTGSDAEEPDVFSEIKNEGDPKAKRGGSKEKSDPLSTFTINLNQLAKKGKIDPLIGRKNELDRILQTLCRRRKNNPILVGEAGVGKTALAEGLARMIVEGEVPELLAKAEVYSLDMGTLLAGARFRGDFEGRLKTVINALIKRQEKGFMPILFIDEIHTVVGAGAVSGGTLDAANILKPLLSRGEVRCMGSTTYAEYRNVFEKDQALSRRFQKIDVVEPTQEEAIQILKGLKPAFEEYHETEILDEALKSAVELSAKHLTDRFLPDKAIDVVDEAGAKARLSKRKVIDSESIEEMISQIARVPAKAVSVDHREKIKGLEQVLKLTIFGQDEAIEAIVTAIRLARSGLRSGEKPVGSFLFCGPTGVGKTELSKQLALALGVTFQRLDMSEYMEKHTASRLIGAPPGYVGFDQPGLLTEGVRKNPHCVILLDEIEKAHPDVWNLLLQVMDHGTLTDNYGRKADFKNAIIIMTSNVGARDLERRPLGMTGALNMGSSVKEVERTFSPEFRNRLDSILYFNPLSEATIEQVVDKQLAELESQLLARQVELEVSAEVRQWLAKKGYDRVMGARPMARLIQDKIRKPLSAEILFGKLEFGGKVKVTLSKDQNEEVIFSYVARKAPDQDGGSRKASSKTERVE